MKQIILLLIIALLLTGCGAPAAPADIAATTLPVYEFTLRLCEGTPLTVTRLVTEEVSCLHDYSLNVRQVKAAEAARVTVISGAGLEDFLDGVIAQDAVIDASQGIPLLSGESEHHHGHDGEEAHHHGHDGEEAHHHHGEDPHIWLSPENAKQMAVNICDGLAQVYPKYEEQFRGNLQPLLEELDALQRYGDSQLAELACREIITFHDGFAYFAHAFDLTVLRSMEEESGREASAKELIELIGEVEYHALPAVFTEKSGSVSAAGILSRETGCGVYALDMAMSGESYFDAMYRNIDTVKEALQ